MPLRFLPNYWISSLLMLHQRLLKVGQLLVYYKRNMCNAFYSLFVEVKCNAHNVYDNFH